MYFVPSPQSEQKPKEEPRSLFNWEMAPSAGVKNIEGEEDAGVSGQSSFFTHKDFASNFARMKKKSLSFHHSS